MKFLALYLGGASMKGAARGAGYCGSSASALCNTGAAILRRAVATDARIAQLFLDKVMNSRSESLRLKGLSILVNTMFFRR
jgi:hypothetical protein